MKDFDYYVEDFMLYCSAKNLAIKTMKSYEQTLKLFQLYMEKEQDTREVEKVSTRQIRQYVEYLRTRGIQFKLPIVMLIILLTGLI